MLIILTAVEKVAVNFGKENEKWLDEMTVEEAQKYVDEGQFAPGSMLPKVQAAMDFCLFQRRTLSHDYASRKSQRRYSGQDRD